jgi:hypothetical protein
MEVALATAFIGTRTAELQLAVAAKMLRMNAQTARSVMQVIESAQENLNRLGSLASGVGEKLDISV